MAASITLLVMGPAISCVQDSGIIPYLLTSPTIGFTPTTEFFEAGLKIDPEVSVPMAT